MKNLLINSIVALLVTACGCSCVSTVERANIMPAESREGYVAAHPEGTYNECIRDGEIMAGMTMNEVIASWGLPNVYVVAATQPEEQWIYYLKDRDSLSMLIYTLSFSDDTLRIWDIDQKRFVGQGIVSYDKTGRQIPVATSPPSKKR